MADREQTPITEPIVVGELLAGGEALLVAAAPLFVLVFCVVHGVTVQDIVRTVTPTLAANEQLDLWSVILAPSLLLSSAIISFLIAFVLVFVTAAGVIVWRLAAWGLGTASDRSSMRRYGALADADTVAADAWSRNLPDPDPVGYDRGDDEDVDQPPPEPEPSRPGGARPSPLLSPVDWSAEREICTTWTNQTHAWVAAMNAWIATGAEHGWDAAGPQPEDPRTADLTQAIVALVERANHHGDGLTVRKKIATAHAPLMPWLEAGTRAVSNLVLLDDGRCVATLGELWSDPEVRVFDARGAHRELPGVSLVGRTGAWFALWTADGIQLRQELLGEGTTLPLPTGSEGSTGPVDASRQHPEALAPLPDGSGVVVTTSCGVFLSRPGGVTRLYPPTAELAEEIDRWNTEFGEAFDLRFDMVHAAVSPDGSLVACGSQDSQHLLVDLDGEVVARFGPVHSSYAHHAGFSPDGALTIANSCHFYNGVTVISDVAGLRGAHIPDDEEDPRLRTLDEGARVYCSAWLDRSTVLLGDAHGYVHARGLDGTDKGRHFVGSTVTSLAVSAAGTDVVIGTAAGFLSFVDPRPVDGADPAVIGTLGWREWRRFVAWKGKPVLTW